MKPKRVILCLAHAAQASLLRVVLETNGYRVLTAGDVAPGKLRELAGIDLVVIGHRLEVEESELPIPSLRLQPDMSTAQMLERMRVLLIRKRGPKAKPVASCQLPVARKAAG